MYLGTLTVQGEPVTVWVVMRVGAIGLEGKA